MLAYSGDIFLGWIGVMRHADRPFEEDAAPHLDGFANGAFLRHLVDNQLAEGLLDGFLVELVRPEGNGEGCWLATAQHTQRPEVDALSRK